jgi:uncharacterized membrane protein YhhN
MSYPAPVATTSASDRTGKISALLLGVFILVSAARLVAIPIDVPFDLAHWSTFALMPSLAAWVLARRGPVLVAVALLCSAAGDILLGVAGQFIAGMGCFAVAHILYVTHFVRSGALGRLGRQWYIVAGYAVVWAVLVVWLWPGLGDLRVPVAAYSLLLASTAITSAGLGAWTGLGGGLFFASDALIGLEKAGLPQPPLPSMWVMTTYIGAQVLLASGTMRRAS